MIIQEPLLKRQNRVVERGKTFLPVLGLNAPRGYDCGDEKGLVYIDAATDGVYDFQFCFLLAKNSEKEAGTGSPHI